MATARKPRSLQFDKLESRLALAGNVTAQIVAGDLIVRGDDAANLIRIDSQQLRAGKVRVVADPSGTVNGESSAVVLSGWTGDTRILLGDGMDRVTLDRLRLPGSLSIRAGLRDDTVVVDRCQINDTLFAQMGSGHDTLHVVNSQVRGRTWLGTGGGNDVVALSGSTFQTSVEIKTGRGNDTVQLGATFRGRLSVDTNPGSDTIASNAVSARFDFRRGAQGWQAGFADYPAGQEKFYELEAGIRKLPTELGPSATGFLVKGNNHSDDLFMFLKRQLTKANGIAANQTYQVRIRTVVASNAPSGAVGIGGAPGESVFLKAGASATEPKAVANKDFVSMNVDKGNQSTGGRAASVVGSIANGNQISDGVDKYASLTRTHVHEFHATANAKGELWLLVGTDSGFEGTTALYYQNIEVELIPIARTT